MIPSATASYSIQDNPPIWLALHFALLWQGWHPYFLLDATPEVQLLLLLSTHYMALLAPFPAAPLALLHLLCHASYIGVCCRHGRHLLSFTLH